MTNFNLPIDLNKVFETTFNGKKLTSGNLTLGLPIHYGIYWERHICYWVLDNEKIKQN